VNTLSIHQGKLVGDNTDAEGFVAAVEAHATLHSDRPAIVLGAGGAGRAVAAGLAARGVPVVHLLNRSEPTAQAAASHLAAYFPGTRFVAGALTSEHFSLLAPSAGLVAVCVSGGARTAIETLNPAPLPSDVTWCDVNYWMRDPPHRAALGARFLGGHPMLIHQAAIAFSRWTSIRPDPHDLPLEALRA
jgi:shikimate dehydrogenase